MPDAQVRVSQRDPIDPDRGRKLRVEPFVMAIPAGGLNGDSHSAASTALAPSPDERFGLLRAIGLGVMFSLPVWALVGAAIYALFR
jgi:hypothetical protein